VCGRNMGSGAKGRAKRSVARVDVDAWTYGHVTHTHVVNFDSQQTATDWIGVRQTDFWS